MKGETKSKILLYYPPNKKSVAIETLCKAVKNAGHELVVLTLTEKGSFHEALDKMNIPNFVYVVRKTNAASYYYKHFRFLIKFCKQHKIDTIWSHLQEANIISIFAKFFSRYRLVNFRHHDETSFYIKFAHKYGLKRNKNEILFDKLINRFSPEILVPSIGVYNAMKKFENVDIKKVKVLPYFYNFSAYDQPNQQNVSNIRNRFPARLLLIMVARMVHSKMHLEVFQAVKKLRENQLDIQLIVMDTGPLESELKEFVVTNELTEAIHFTGYQKNVLEFMQAADILVHPSLVESFGHVPLEMGYVKRPVMVCKGVGIFDELIDNGMNGFLLDPDNLQDELESGINRIYSNIDQLSQLGETLFQKVMLRYNYTEAEVYKQCGQFC